MLPFLTLMMTVVSSLSARWRNREYGPPDLESIRSFEADGQDGIDAYYPKSVYGNTLYRTRLPWWQKSAQHYLIAVGAVVIRNMLPLSHIPDTTSAEEAMAEKKQDGLLKHGQYNFGASWNEIDEKRFSLELDETNQAELAPWRANVLTRVEYVLRRFHLIGWNHKMEGMTLLKTLKDSIAQYFHSDYARGGCFRNIEPVKGRYDVHPCTPWAISVLIAIDPDGATLNFPCGQLKLGFGDAVVFSGDLRHAGSGYTKDNVRLHVYYGYEDVDRNEKKLVESEMDGTRKVFKSDLED